jgi:CheY-like chemotaxis protein
MARQIAHILALEPDSERGELLKQFVRERVDAEIVVARSGPAAIAAMTSQRPNLILASALALPEDEAQLVSHLKQLGADPDVPVLMVPPVSQSYASTKSWGNRLFFLFGRQANVPSPPFDADAISGRIAEALQQSQSAASSTQIRLLKGSNPARISPREQPAPTSMSEPVVRRLDDSPRARSHRWAPEELPWLCSVHTPWGLEARVLNISRSGMLIESHSKLVPDSSVEFRLCGPGTKLIVPAHVVRSEVSAVNVRGVKYRAAAAFSSGLELLSEGSAVPTLSPATDQRFAQLLVRLSLELGRGQRGDIIRTMFEQGLQQLTGAREIKICELPVVQGDGNESIYFRVPSAAGAGKILQVTFDPNRAPTAEDFKLLKAAASAAAMFVLCERTPSMTPLAAEDPSTVTDNASSAPQAALLTARPFRVVGNDRPQPQNSW